MSLRSGERLRVGGDLWARDIGGGRYFRGNWVGWARDDKLSTIWAGRLDFGLLIGKALFGPDGKVKDWDKVQEYTERDGKSNQLVWFTIPEGHALAVGRVVADKLQFGTSTYLAGDLLLITRLASEEELRVCDHTRHPVLLPTKAA